MQKKFKRTANGQFKADSPPPSAASTTGGGSESPSVTPSGVQTPMHNSLSVNINVDANLHRSQSAIKLTFSSTINGHAAQPTVSQQQQQMTPMSGGDFCKSELDAATTPGPTTDPASVSDPQTSGFAAADGDSIDNSEYLDDLAELLDRLVEDPPSFDVAVETNERPGAPPPGSRDVVAMSGRYSSAPPYYPPAYCGSTAFPTAPVTTDAAAPAGCVGLMPGAPSAPTLLGDTGPAAETLKQMAAQHQSLHDNSVVGRHYAYPDGGGYPAAFRGAAGAVRMPPPRYRAVQLAAGGAGGYMMPADPSTMCHVDPRAAAAAGYGPVYPDTPPYGAAAPSSAAQFGGGVPQHGHCVTSSLQRLETQVRSQFAPMPVAPSPLSTDSQQQQQHFRLEQSQRVDVRAPGQLVVAQQQQSFVMSMDAAQDPAASQRAYPSPAANPAAYSHYPAGPPVAYRIPAAPFVVASGTAPGGGYGGMPVRMLQQHQSAVGVPPSYAAVQSLDQNNASVAGGPPNTARGRASSASSSSSVHGLPPSTNTVTQLQLPTKVEAGLAYSAGDAPADTAAGGLKGAGDAAPASANYAAAMPHAKLAHPLQRPPNVTVVPGRTGAMNFHPHPAAGAVKWMPSGASVRAPYPGVGYAMDGASSRHSDNSGAAAGWSLAMSQTQSLYMSNAAGGDGAYRHCGPPNLAAAAGYAPGGPVGAVQSADQSRMQRIPPNAAAADVVFQRSAAAAAPGQVYMDPAFPGAYNSRDFAFTDTVFVSK